ncbi:hypothetical protein MRB53_012829 [Persea americana]|uniref:Uncharacterized protein n=1 Tax=Persea americana TaxID=3435 RepID=A0ACC2LYK3_PERAE|nr:hypothetical protein MRB53_012829 [Persea americana]
MVQYDLGRCRYNADVNAGFRNLSSTGLKGEIATSLANVKSIQSLDLSWNNLTGPIPNFLGDLPSLSLLNLSGNQLDGLVPPNLLEKVNKGSLQLSPTWVRMLFQESLIRTPLESKRPRYISEILRGINSGATGEYGTSRRRHHGLVAGFISINCGMVEGSTHIEIINTTYQSDAKYIETGVNHNLSKAFLPATILQQLYSNVRSFPSGSRNCYNLSEITKGTKYLLRVHLWYGNYDGRNSTPQFDIYIGVNRWMIINDRSSVPFVKEIILMAKMNYVSVCLLNTGLGIPFISAIELRPLNNSMYKVVNETHSLERWDQYDFGRPRYNNTDVNAGISSIVYIDAYSELHSQPTKTRKKEKTLVVIISGPLLIFRPSANTPAETVNLLHLTILTSLCPTSNLRNIKIYSSRLSLPEAKPRLSSPDQHACKDLSIEPTCYLTQLQLANSLINSSNHQPINSLTTCPPETPSSTAATGGTRTPSAAPAPLPIGGFSTSARASSKVRRAPTSRSVQQDGIIQLVIEIVAAKIDKFERFAAGERQRDLPEEMVVAQIEDF